MFSHLGLKNHEKYFSTLARFSKPETIFLLQSILTLLGENSKNRAAFPQWLDENIFHGAQVPSTHEPIQAAESQGWICGDFEEMPPFSEYSTSTWCSAGLSSNLEQELLGNIRSYGTTGPKEWKHDGRGFLRVLCSITRLFKSGKTELPPSVGLCF